MGDIIPEKICTPPYEELYIVARLYKFHINGIQEVRSSILLSSIKKKTIDPRNVHVCEDLFLWAREWGLLV